MYQKLDKNTIRKIHLQIGVNVKKYRKNCGLSQMDLSNSLGYKSISTLAMAEINYKDAHFNIENLANISKYLKVDINKFFEGVNDILDK